MSLNPAEHRAHVTPILLLLLATLVLSFLASSSYRGIAHDEG